MSEQGVTALLNRVKSDEGFRERLLAAPGADARRQIIADEGFDVEPSDIPALRAQAGVQELSDDDLERVAGGGSPEVGSVATVVVAGVAAAAAVCCA